MRPSATQMAAPQLPFWVAILASYTSDLEMYIKALPSLDFKNAKGKQECSGDDTPARSAGLLSPRPEGLGDLQIHSEPGRAAQALKHPPKPNPHWPCAKARIRTWVGFPSDFCFWLPLHQGYTLFNPVEFQPMVGLTPDFRLPCFLQPGWEGCRSKHHQTAARTEC
jgi:hypothetical protein